MTESHNASNDNKMSDELTAKLIHFHDITQIDDLERCKTILRQHDWNIEMAVQSTFVDPVPQPSIQSQPPSAPGPSNVNIGVRRAPTPPYSLLHHQNVIPRQMIYVGGRRPQPPQGLLGWGFFLLMSPIKYTFNQVFNILKFVYRLFFPDPRERITNPLGDVQAFITEFERKFPDHPDFFQGTYGNAQAEAKAQLRFLLVYLHDFDHKDSQPFCHGTLCHPESIQYINRNMLFWACSIDKPEGYRVSKTLRNDTYPLLALVCLCQNRMTVVGRLQGKITSEELIGRLSEVVEVYEPVLVAARADKEERSQNQIIRQEQDEAYEISLQKDKEKMDKKRREEEEAQKIKESKEEIKKEKEHAKELCLQKRARCRDELPIEPEATAEDVMTFVVKLPNGCRLTRRFLSTDTVKVLHDYVYAQDNAPRRFQIFSNFPRRPLSGCCTDSFDEEDNSKNLILKDVGLNRSDTLFVQAIHDDEDDSTDESDSESDHDDSR
ncbi:unnamed protein product [Clavelina lepadiformis]|uniref:UBX domain-containing protein n=1 Tax=Clavelina lepadiformis TaxID=159417 RepID=A0ABP0H315_CLALP